MSRSGELTRALTSETRARTLRMREAERAAKDGDVWRIDCSRFEKVGRNREMLDSGAGWTWNRHGHYDSHIPEVFPYVTFSGKTVG